MREVKHGEVQRPPELHPGLGLQARQNNVEDAFNVSLFHLGAKCEPDYHSDLVPVSNSCSVIE